MDVSILRDGEVKGALLVKSSGTAEIDVSALRAAERIKNIGVRLQTEFLGGRVNNNELKHGIQHLVKEHARMGA